MSLIKLNSVKSKLTLSILLLTLIVVLFVGFYFPWKFKIEQLEALDDKSQTITSIIANNIAASIYFEDMDALKEDLNRLLSYNEIGYIVVKSQEEIIYDYKLEVAQKNNYLVASNPNNSEENNFYKTKSRIVLAKNEIGDLFIGFSLQNLETQISEIQATLFIINIIILVIGTFLSFVIGYFFTKPINELVAVSDEVKNGNFNARVKIFSNDEIGYLANRFNVMVETLDEFYAHLENKVEARTKELAEANKKLEFEIDERKNAEQKIKISLDEKILLLKEIHHRVKNNLQIISSLLFLQSNKVDDPEAKEFFTESQNRIISMALVHENLYKSESLTQVAFSNYIQHIIQNLTESYSIDSNITIKTNLDEVYLSIDSSIPLGLILNELITNSIKHGFKVSEIGSNDTNKTLYVNLFNSEMIVLEVGDNGVGLPENIDLHSNTSLGMKIISSLVNQLDAELKIDRTNGTKFSIILPKTTY